MAEPLTHSEIDENESPPGPDYEDFQNQDQQVIEDDTTIEQPLRS
jgi:hypothetical protein